MAPAVGAMLPGAVMPDSTPLYRMDTVDDELLKAAQMIERGSFTGDVQGTLAAIISQMQRGITSSITAFPKRENLEAEAKILVPVETPLRNRLARTPGSGTASEWKQITSFGTGFGTQTETTGTTNATDTLEVDNANGFYAGESIDWSKGGTPETHVIVSIDYGTDIITVAASPGITTNTQADNELVIKSSLFQPAGGVATRAFFAETGAPLEKTTVYADRSEGYKFLGELGSVTVFAMASGNTFQNQLAVEKRNRLYSVMLSEENALVNGDDSDVNAPWGDDTTNLAYQGLIPHVRANAPASHLQTSVGALTTGHIDIQLTRQHYQGGRGLFMLMNGQEIISLAKIAMSSANNHRVIVEEQRNTALGVRIAKYIHPVSGEPVEVLWDPFVPSGTIVFGADYLPDGSPAADVSVLPQVHLPELAPNENVQGYVAQELAPSQSAPHVMPFILSVFEVLRVKGSTVFGLSEGVDAA